MHGTSSPTEKRSMSLTLAGPDMDALEELAREKDLSKTAVIRQALRLYQLLDARLSKGEKVLLEDRDKKQSELVVL